MSPEESVSVVRRYYESFGNDSTAAMTTALEGVLDAAFVLESPLVEAKFGGPVTGPTAMSAALGAAPFLKNVTVEALYASAHGDGVASLIHFPTPAGFIVQSEHFDIDAGTGLITRLRSFYDPRPLLRT